ncbi:hypothetical protein NIES2107_56780 [Nostoc carneum NIES-2107]|nr:hypothetical protein NIES2107_56780 [Nostoc carneum NIES-2107]
MDFNTTEFRGKGKREMAFAFYLFLLPKSIMVTKSAAIPKESPHIRAVSSAREIIQLL